VTITKEIETISKRFEERDVCGKVILKSKLWEIAYLNVNSMCPLLEKVNTKGAKKKPMTKHQRSTKRDLSYWEYVDVEAKLHGESKVIQRCFDDNNDDNKR